MNETISSTAVGTSRAVIHGYGKSGAPTYSPVRTRTARIRAACAAATSLSGRSPTYTQRVGSTRRSRAQLPQPRHGRLMGGQVTKAMEIDREWR
jgi:hypothetical protein